VVSETLMAYTKSILIGLVAVLAFELLYTAVTILVAFISVGGKWILLTGGYWGWDWRYYLTWTGGGPIVLAFAAGFYWEFRRTSKRLP
jgi:hypothetical protein